MKRSGLPPLLKTIKDGNITWERLEGVDHDTLGYLLSCHLIIEHYLTEALKSRSWPLDELQWDAARLSFSQKVRIVPPSMLGQISSLIPCLKHLNSLRNKFSHDIAFRLSGDDLAPLSGFLKDLIRSPEEVPSGAIEILEMFTAVACSGFAGYIARGAHEFKPSRS